MAGPPDRARDIIMAQVCFRNTCWWRSNSALGGLRVNASQRNQKTKNGGKTQPCFPALCFFVFLFFVYNHMVTALSQTQITAETSLRTSRNASCSCSLAKNFLSVNPCRSESHRLRLEMQFVFGDVNLFYQFLQTEAMYVT